MANLSNKADAAAAPAAPAAAAAAASSPAGGVAVAGFESAAIFASLEGRLTAAGDAPVKQVGAVYEFHVTGGAGGKAQSWTVDLKSGPHGKVAAGKPAKADVVLTLSDQNCTLLFNGKLNPQQAFMGGQLKMQGNMALAMKLGALIDSGRSKL